MDDPDCPPVIPNYNDARETSPTVLRQFFIDAHRMLTAMFSADLVEGPGRNRLLALSMVFLSGFDQMDELAVPNRKKAKPIYLAKYNTCGVLRCPQHFMDHSLVRILHEGGDMGEGLVKVLRALCPSAVREGWAEHLVNRFYRSRVQSVLATDIAGTNASSDTKEKGLNKHVTEKFRRYTRNTDHDEAATAIGNGEFVSILVYFDNHRYRFGIVQKMTNNWQFREINLDETDPWDDPFGFTYYDISLVDEETDFTKPTTLSMAGWTLHSISYLVPSLPNEVVPGRESNAGRYAVLTEDWQQYHQGEFWVIK